VKCGSCGFVLFSSECGGKLTSYPHYNIPVCEPHGYFTKESQPIVYIEYVVRMWGGRCPRCLSPIPSNDVRVEVLERAKRQRSA